ncbi:MAG: hypothetical protein AAGD14_09135 [Planctomycetota bacterium]
MKGAWTPAQFRLVTAGALAAVALGMLGLSSLHAWLHAPPEILRDSLARPGPERPIAPPKPSPQTAPVPIPALQPPTEDEVHDALTRRGFREVESNQWVSVWVLDDEAGEGIAEEFANAVSYVHEITALAIPGQRATLVRCRTPADANRVLRSFEKGRIRERVHGTFYPWLNAALVLDRKGYMSTVAHEAVHWYLHHAAPGCPPALDEGLAVYVAERLSERTMRSRMEAYAAREKCSVSIALGSSVARAERVHKAADPLPPPTVAELCIAHGREVWGGSGLRPRMHREYGFYLAATLHVGSRFSGVTLPEALEIVRPRRPDLRALLDRLETPAFQNTWHRMLRHPWITALEIDAPAAAPD